MLNISQLTYNNIFTEISDITQKFYFESQQEVIANPQYCSYLQQDHRNAIMFFNNICAMLKSQYLSEAATLAIAIVPRIEKEVEYLIQFFADMHNYLVINTHQEEVKIKRFLEYINNQIDIRIINVKSLCETLLQSTIFTKKRFIYVAACVNGIECSLYQITLSITNHRQYKTIKDLCDKTTQNSVSTGKHLMSIDFETLKVQKIDMKKYIKVSEKHYRDAKTAYNNFLSSTLQKKYYCRANINTLTSIHNTHISNSTYNKKFFAEGIHIFLCNGDLKVVKERVPLLEPRVKKHQVSNSTTSPSTSAVQQLSTEKTRIQTYKILKPHIETIEEIEICTQTNEGDNLVASPSTSTQQRLPIKKTRSQTTYYILEPCIEPTSEKMEICTRTNEVDNSVESPSTNTQQQLDTEKEMNSQQLYHTYTEHTFEEIYQDEINELDNSVESPSTNTQQQLDTEKEMNSQQLYHTYTEHTFEEIYQDEINELDNSVESPSSNVTQQQCTQIHNHNENLYKLL